MSESKKPYLVAVVGPTASGKTALSVALAKRLNGEIVSADSMQIYRRMTIATAKPTPEEQQGVAHHLMDFLEPSESFSVSDYQKMAHQAVRDILSRGKLPIFCGGTGLYLRTFFDNVSFTKEPGDEALRTRLNEQYRQEGGEALLQELAKIDPKTAKTLHPADAKRIIRALEIFATTGVPMSEQVRLSHAQPLPYSFTMLGLTFRDRQKLYDRIDRRVDEMFSRGLLQEARSFYASAAGRTAQAAIGYKELLPYLNGTISLEEAAANLKQATRRYAKRQLTWFRRDSYIRWIYVDNCGNILQEALSILQQEHPDLFRQVPAS